MKEVDFMKKIQVELVKAGLRLFRNNTGVAWQGNVVNHSPLLLTLANPRPVHMGLCKGSSDLIGWKTITVTKEMVGRRLAVFTAIETKSLGKKATAEQAAFLNTVQLAGGTALLAKPDTDLSSIL